MSPLEREQLSEFADHVAGMKQQLRLYEARIAELSGDLEAAQGAHRALLDHSLYLSERVRALELETADAKARVLSVEAMAMKPDDMSDILASRRAYAVRAAALVASNPVALDEWSPDDTGVRRRIAKLQAVGSEPLATDLPEDCSCSTSTEAECEPLFPRGRAPKIPGES